MMKDPRFNVAYQPVCDYRPYEYARNETVSRARSVGADWLVSFDNDCYVEGNPLDVIAEAGDKDVIGLTVGLGRFPVVMNYPFQNHGAEDGSFREEESVAGGVLMIRNSVWHKIPGPWFRWQHADNELLAPAVGGMDEVSYFCNLVKRNGLRVWTHRSMTASHLNVMDVTKVVSTLDDWTGGRWTHG